MNWDSMWAQNWVEQTRSELEERDSYRLSTLAQAILPQDVLIGLSPNNDVMYKRYCIVRDPRIVHKKMIR